MEDQSDPADPYSFIYKLIFISGDLILANISYGLIIIMLIVFSAYISSIDFAFLSLNNESAEIIKKSNLLYFKRITFLLHNKKKIAVAFRIIRTIVIASIGIIFTYSTFSILYFHDNPSFAIVSLIILLSVVIISINEIVPRIFVKNPLEFLGKSFFISFVIVKVFTPLTKYLSQLNTKKKAPRNSPELVENTFQEFHATEEEEISDEHAEIPNTKKNLESLSLRKIMINRLDIRAFEWDMSFDEILKEINKFGFSRIPVYKETIDSIEGILYVKDLLFHIDEKEIFDWHSVLRPGFFIPESKKIDDLLKEFQDKKVHMAIIVDEYGGTSGLVTMEDILEEIVGDINDEFDQNQNYYYSTLDENTFIFDGDIPVKEFLKIYELEEEILSEEINKTLGEFLIKQLGFLPEIGEQIKFNKFEFTIIGVDDKNINRVKVYIQDQSNKEEHLV